MSAESGPGSSEDTLQRVEFESNLDELADFHLDILDRTEHGRAMRRKYVVYNTVLSSVFFAVFMVVIGRLLIGALFLVGVGVLSIVFGLLIRFFLARTYTRARRRNTIRLLEERVGSQRSFSCEIMLKPSGVAVEQNNYTLFFKWEDILSIEDTPEGPWLRFRVGDVLARNRGFPDDPARKAFLATARRLATDAKLPERPGGSATPARTGPPETDSPAAP